MRPIQVLAQPEFGRRVRDTDVFLRPIDLVHDHAALPELDQERERLLGGGPVRFRKLEIILRSRERIAAFSGTVSMVRDWATKVGCDDQVDAGIFRIARRRRPLFGRMWNRPLIVGIVNVTPDSFSDRVDRRDTALAVAQAHGLIEAGADILDIGGESTRPDARPVSKAEEIDRVVPVIEKAAGFGRLISIDTSKAAVMIAALSAGASIINDVTALTGDPDSLKVARRSRAPVILMHMQGRPQTMQNEPYYDCPPLDVADYLAARVAACVDGGISASNIIVDPGIGFGKTDQHNFAIMARIGIFHGIGVPIMLGASRKSLIGRTSGGDGPGSRLGGSLALALGALEQGVQMVRVHDVAETRQALALRQAVLDGL